MKTPFTMPPLLAGCGLADPSDSDEDEAAVFGEATQGDLASGVPDESEQVLQALRNGSGIAELEQALGVLTNLTRLDLSDTFLGCSVLLLPQNLPHLRTLNLSESEDIHFYCMGYPPQGRWAVAAASTHVLRCYPHLTHLDISGHCVDDSECLRSGRATFSTLWRDALAALPELRVLRMQECLMDDARPLAALAPTLQRLTRLEQLDLGGNLLRMHHVDIGLFCGKGRELSSFWSALRRLTALTRLDLHETCLGRSCLSRLTQVCV